MKLLAAVGAITGPFNCFLVFILTAVLGGVIALVMLLMRGRVRHTFFNVAWMMREMLQFRAPYKSNEELDVKSAKGMRLPHAAMIAVGVAAFVVMAQLKIRIGA